MSGAREPHRPWLLTIAGVALGVFAILGGVVARHGDGPVTTFDEAPLQTLTGARTEPLTTTMRVISKVTTTKALAVIAFGAVIFLWRRARRSAVFLVAALGGAAALNVLAKWGWARKRPEVPIALFDRATPSFPSGHAMTTAAFLLALFLIARRIGGRKAQYSAAIGGLAVGLIVGVGRVYLGVHYPTDVLAGWCLGTGWTLALEVWHLRGKPDRFDRLPDQP